MTRTGGRSLVYILAICRTREMATLTCAVAALLRSTTVVAGAADFLSTIEVHLAAAEVEAEAEAEDPTGSGQTLTLFPTTASRGFVQTAQPAKGRWTTAAT
jgi:hypothetical protein